jgi:hypothetical protein
MKTIKPSLFWTVSSSSVSSNNVDYKRVSVVDTVSSSGNENYKTVSIVDSQ